MMKIEVTHTIKFDSKVEGLLELVAAALTGSIATSKTVEVAEQVQTEEPVKHVQVNVAEKTLHFQHEGSGDLVVVKKGESLDFLESDSFIPLKPYEYNRLKFDQEKAAEKTDEPEDTNKDSAVSEEQSSTEESEAVTLELADLRVVAAKFVSAAKQKELKALFGEFNDADGKPAVKISAIQESDYNTFMDRAKEVLAELGVE